MSRPASPAVVLALLLAGCATTASRQRSAAAGERWSESDLPETDEEPPRARIEGALATFDLQARLSVRARSYLGRRGPFQAKGQRFGGDCSGFVAAVYSAEGLMLRDLMQRVAPEERSGVAAAWYAARAHGRVFGAGEWPAPGDLVFWHDTYDRNRNGRADDRFTHLGIVEYVEDGTVYFLHRGGRGVARGVMTPGRPWEATDGDGRRLNSAIRATTHPVKQGGLAGALLAGYGRLDPGRVPPELASTRVDPYFGAGADREPEAEPGASASPSAAPSDSTPLPAAVPAPPAVPTPIPTSGPTTSSTPARASVPATRTAGKATAKKVPKRKRSATKKASARAKPPVAKARTPAEVSTSAKAPAR